MRTRKIFLYATTVLLTGCFGPAALELRVAPLGEEVPETIERHLYVLPQTVLKLEVAYQEMKHVPGPFRDYAEKYLGITEVIRSNFSQWQLLDVQVTPHVEPDPGQFYHVNVLEGEFDGQEMERLLARGIILDGMGMVEEGIRSPLLGAGAIRDYVHYRDLGIESNFEERTETMYKTIVTDTSFVQVPVNRTINEQKSPAIKAREAADFILELRTRRFELLTGELEGFPQGEAMQATLDKLDELEASYLTLFTGKTFGTTYRKSWFIVPDPGQDPSRYQLGMFSKQLGFVPEDLNEGSPLEVWIRPMGKTALATGYFAEKTDSAANNLFIYRLPDVVQMEVIYEGEVLSDHRVSVYQSGALVTAPAE